MRNTKAYYITIFLLVVAFETSFSQNAEKIFNSGYHYLTVDNRIAVNTFSRSIQMDSSNANAFYYRGIGYYKLALYDSALQDFITAEKLDSALTQIPVYKAFLFRQREQYDSALYYFNDYIQKNPKDTAAYSLIIRGKLQILLENHDEALVDFQNALNLDPVQESFYYYKFMAHFEKRDFDNAITQINKAINLNPSFYGYYFYKGNTFFEMGKYQPAIEQYSLALDLNVNNADIYYHRGMAEQAMKNITEAISDYNAAIAYNDKDGTYFFQRGHAFLELGDKFKACNDWYMAGALGYYEDFDKIKEVCE
ncbi:MAG: tetratricopeptide repeat protein [Cyclobacteriaceae bacterium]|nr:tetratricopeptide repeat protein [Cyclobacteriaceae bacterium]